MTYGWLSLKSLNYKNYCPLTWIAKFCDEQKNGLKIYDD